MTEKNSNKYCENSFWRKIKTHAKAIGKELVFNALVIFYTLKDPNTSTGTKLICIGALSYLISPFDVIPDILPGGYADDLGIIVAAYKAVSSSLNEDIIKKGKNSFEVIFGEVYDKTSR